MLPGERGKSAETQRKTTILEAMDKGEFLVGFRSTDYAA